MAQLQSENERQDAVPDDGSPKYMPSTDETDPIVRALKTVLKCKEVTGGGAVGSRPGSVQVVACWGVAYRGAFRVSGWFGRRSWRRGV